VNRDFFAVCLEELLAVTGLTVCFISRPGIGVIEDVFSKRCDLSNLLLSRTLRGEECFPFFCFLRDKCIQLLHGLEAMLAEEKKRLRHFLQVVDLRLSV